MKKTLPFFTLFIAAAFCFNVSHAQLSDGSIAPNWTMTDINGTSHTLYDYLDQGKPVFIDFFATWCGPCLTYVQAGHLENLYTQYGPSGTNEVMVFSVEGDGSTNTADLNGTGSNTVADWVTLINYPLIDNASQTSAYGIAYWPTIYMVCPNRIIKEVGQGTTAALYSEAQGCAPPASQANDPALLNYTGSTVTCGDVELKVMIQNGGTSNLTSATIECFDGSTSVGIVNWTGNLATYGVEEVTIGTVSISSTTTFSIQITSTDDNASNNTISASVTFDNTETTDTLYLALTTDDYPGETTWNLTSSDGTALFSGGPYSGQANQTFNETFTVAPGECYSFNIYDSYGDGLNASAFGGTDGNYTLTDEDGLTIVANDGSVQFNEESQPFMARTGATAIEETRIGKMEIYPNPTNGDVNIRFNNFIDEANIILTDVLGKTVLQKTYAGINTIALDLNKYNNGIYYLTVRAGKDTTVQKLVLNK
ncbi:MAG: hypothetical protein COA57_05530 [Flavobacteriales bacterium]|nr:T9SS type A sorting domain-containing protein [Bacteroidales bacterium AH-315-I05]PCJ86776.1 MAG: hypothetical protein COA57_05530 [Flavobacteriales bacterium]